MKKYECLVCGDVFEVQDGEEAVWRSVKKRAQPSSQKRKRKDGLPSAVAVPYKGSDNI